MSRQPCNNTVCCLTLDDVQFYDKARHLEYRMRSSHCLSYKRGFVDDGVEMTLKSIFVKLVLLRQLTFPFQAVCIGDGGNVHAPLPTYQRLHCLFSSLLWGMHALPPRDYWSPAITPAPYNILTEQYAWVTVAFTHLSALTLSLLVATVGHACAAPS